MFKKLGFRLQSVPTMHRCCSCHRLKFAIASQILIHQSSGRPYFRWICEDCGKTRGIYPTREYWINFDQMDGEGGVKGVMKYLVQAESVELIN